MPAPPRFACFAVCPPGLESITRAELFRLGVNHPQALPGGVAFSGFLGHLYRVNLWSRTASRVLVRVGEFEAKSFPELERKAAGLAWESLLPASASVTVHATCHKSRLYHSEAVAERVAAAIPARLNGPAVRQRPTTTATSDSTSFFNQSHQSNTSVESAKHLPWAPVPGSVDENDDFLNGIRANGQLPEAASQTVVARLDHDRCTLSLDSSGVHLHQRGYRLETAKAPLRETLAAALLLHARYDPALPLLDPFCGSGTFAIEAALLARNLAPGLGRRFTFMAWINFDAGEWAGQTAQARAASRPAAPAPILASDRDAGAVSAAAANAARAGVADSIQMTAASISAIQPPPGPGLVIANLPYGRRLSGAASQDVRNVYARFGSVVRERCPGWRVGLLAGSLALAKQTRLAWGEPLWIDNGGLKVPFVLS